MKILIIDDEKSCADQLSKFIKALGHEVQTLYDGLEALNEIKKNHFDIIISDVNMPYISGIEILNVVKKEKPHTEIILISGKAEVIESINALELGVLDFLVKPVDVRPIAELIKKVKSNKKSASTPFTFAAENILKMEDTKQIKISELNRYFKNNISNNFYGNVCICSDKLKNIYNKLNKLQEYMDIPVLITGSTGTGKELIAKNIHYQSKYKDKPFIAVNCANLGKDIFESELFGYEKGAFTGADPAGKIGLISLAEGGAIFLDEISEIPVELQSKLLRVIQEREYFAVGGRQSLTINTRIICASNRNLDELAENGLFRKDLFYRLNVCRIHIPDLNERRDEIIPLCASLIEQNKIVHKLKINFIEAGFLKKALTYNWPGNIRELKNLITGIMIFNDSDKITTEDFTNHITGLSNSESDLLNPGNLKLPEKSFNLDEYYFLIVKKTLEKFNNNKTKAAAYLQIPRNKFYTIFKDIKKSK